MRLFLLCLLTMLAFAGNSVLNRLAVGHFQMDPGAFAAVRVASGVVALWALVALRPTPWPPLWGRQRITTAVALITYMIGFSIAYRTLDAGIGALILFGVVQVTMFAGVVLTGQPVSGRRWLGLSVSMSGLIILLWPVGAFQVDATGAVYMTLAAIGWGIYSFLGKSESDALGSTAANFLLALPAVATLPLATSTLWPLPMGGVMIACLAGVVTSGLGYALWYRILPALDASLAAIAQLSVPLIAVGMGVAFLGEPVTYRFLAAGALVLGGIWVSTRRP